MNQPCGDVFGQPCAAHVTVVLIMSSTVPVFHYLAQGMINSFLSPRMSGVKSFFKIILASPWDPAEGHVCLFDEGYLFLVICDLAPNDIFFNSKHEVNFLMDLVLIAHLFFPTRG